MEFDKVVESKRKSLQKTNLLWDNYMQYLIEAIDESKFMKRAEIKPMATPKHPLESHVTSRGTHVRNAANIIRRLARGLGLNEQYAYAAMLMHDAGHPFGAHEGEVTFTDIGKLYNTQFFHHNAKGVEVIISEDICEKAISKIPNIELRPELREKLRKEFYYFLDVVISHDGEASPSEMYRDPDEYPDIRTAVDSKLLSANSTNKYKFVSQTPEGRLAKYADVIAYLQTDMQDGFRIGVYKDFPEDYLELFGEMFSDKFISTREEKIANARAIIEAIKEKRLRELFDDAKLPANQRAIRIANKITAELSEKGISFEDDEKAASAIVKKYLEEFQAQFPQTYPDSEQFMYSEMEKIREFVGKKVRMRSGVVAEVTTRMQEFFINDILAASDGTDQIRFSPKGERLFFRAKGLNYETYTPYSKWNHQKFAQPDAALKLVNLCARSLMDTGAIRNKFYDRSIRNLITDKTVLEYMKINIPEGESINDMQERYLSTRMEYNIRNFRTSNKRYTSDGKVTELQARHELYANAYDHVQNEGESFARKFMLTFMAIEPQVRDKVKKALNPNYPEGKDDKEKSIFSDLMIEDVLEIRQRIQDRFGVSEISTEELEQFIQNLIEEERNKMEEKMAIQTSIDYLSGMSDNAFNELAIRTGCLDRKDLEETARVTPEQAAQDEILVNLARDMKQNSGYSGEETGRKPSEEQGEDGGR